MKLLFLALSLVIFSTTSMAASVFKIEFAKDYSGYSDADLKRRVWELERAVWQLQQKVFDMEMSKPTQAPAATWVCRLEAMGEKFSGVGSSRAIAENAAMEKCKASPKSANGFHCDELSCSQ